MIISYFFLPSSSKWSIDNRRSTPLPGSRKSACHTWSCPRWWCSCRRCSGARLWRTSLQSPTGMCSPKKRSSLLLGIGFFYNVKLKIKDFLLCFLMQFLIIPIVLIILIFSIPFLNVQAFNPDGKIKFYFWFILN